MVGKVEGLGVVRKRLGCIEGFKVGREEVGRSVGCIVGIDVVVGRAEGGRVTRAVGARVGGEDALAAETHSPLAMTVLGPYVASGMQLGLGVFLTVEGNLTLLKAMPSRTP